MGNELGFPALWVGEEWPRRQEAREKEGVARRAQIPLVSGL